MAICYPNVNFISTVPTHIFELLVKECESWDYKNQKPIYNRAFYKYITQSYAVSKFSGVCHSPENIQPALDWICSLFINHVPYGAAFFAMSPGQQYPAHADAFNYAMSAKRMHIPVVSKKGNSHVSFHKDNDSDWTCQSWNMKEKNLYELNNAEPHAAENLSDQWRVHFIVDIIDNDVLKSKNNWHHVSENQLKLCSNVERGLINHQNLSRWSFKQMSLDHFNSQKENNL
jgi:hypothetical protein